MLKEKNTKQYSSLLRIVFVASNSISPLVESMCVFFIRHRSSSNRRFSPAHEILRRVFLITSAIFHTEACFVFFFSFETYSDKAKRVVNRPATQKRRNKSVKIYNQQIWWINSAVYCIVISNRIGYGSQRRLIHAYRSSDADDDLMLVFFSFFYAYYARIHFVLPYSFA